MATKRRSARLAELAGHGHGRSLGPAGAHRPPASLPSTTSCWGPPCSSGYAVLFRRSATRKAAPSCAAAQGCGRPVRVSGDTSVASQHRAPPRGVVLSTTRSRRRRSSERTLGAIVCASHCTGASCTFRFRIFSRERIRSKSSRSLTRQAVQGCFRVSPETGTLAKKP